MTIPESLNRLPFPTCFECGHSIELARKPGRTREIERGICAPIPSEVPIPTCTGCGDEAWSVELSDYLDRILRQ